MRFKTSPVDFSITRSWRSIIAALCMVFAPCFNAFGATADVWQFPVSPWVKVGYGFGDNWTVGAQCPTGVWKRHTGIDVQAAAGQQVRAAANGVIRAIVPDSAWGYAVIIESQDACLATNVSHQYWHVAPLAGYGVGRTVARNEVFATVASLGSNTHLHFAIFLASYSSPAADRGALPRASCGGDPAWPSRFTEPTAFVTGRQSPCTTCTNPGGVTRYALADVDGDGDKDLVRYFGAVGRWDVRRSTRTAFAAWARWTCGHGVGSAWQGLGDVDGDARADAIVVVNGIIYVARSTGNSFAPYYRASTTPISGPNRFYATDLDRDGKVDIVANRSSDGYTWRALGSGFTFGSWGAVGSGFGSGSGCIGLYFEDVTGDRCPDAVAVWTDGTWRVAKGRCNGAFYGYYSTPWASGHGSGSSTRHVADIEGNGKSDAICHWRNPSGTSFDGVTIGWSSSGTRFVPNNTPRTLGHGTYAIFTEFADVTGDNRADLVFIDSSGRTYVSRCDGWGFIGPYLWG